MCSASGYSPSQRVPRSGRMQASAVVAAVRFMGAIVLPVRCLVRWSAWSPEQTRPQRCHTIRSSLLSFTLALSAHRGKRWRIADQAERLGGTITRVMRCFRSDRWGIPAHYASRRSIRCACCSPRQVCLVVLSWTSLDGTAPARLPCAVVFVSLGVEWNITVRRAACQAPIFRGSGVPCAVRASPLGLKRCFVCTTPTPVQVDRTLSCLAPVAWDRRPIEPVSTCVGGPCVAPSPYGRSTLELSTEPQPTGTLPVCQAPV